MTQQQKTAFLLVVNAILETVQEADQTFGAPGGILYAALQSHLPHLDLHHFLTIMSALQEAGKVTKRGECYFAI